MCHRFWWHICFFPTAQAKAKKAKEPPSNRTKTLVETDKQATTEKNNEGITRVWRNGGCSASYDSFVVGSSAVLLLNFCAKNPPLRKAPNRWLQPY